MAEGHVFSSSERQSILDCQGSQEIPTASIINNKSSKGLHFDEIKKQFKWYEKVEELVIYVEDQVGLLGTWSVKNNCKLHVFEALDNAVTLNWYCSTSTVQVQGSSKESLVEKMSEAAIRITSNAFEENDAADDNATVLGDISQCQGCTLLRQ